MTTKPNNPPTPDPQAARKRTVKPRTGAPRNNSNAVTTGQRRERTSRGGPQVRDCYDDQGRRYALKLFRERGYDVKDPMRAIVADKESCLRRARATLDRRGWFDSHGEQKAAAASYYSISREQESLIASLERKYVPVVDPARDTGPTRYIALFAPSEGWDHGRAHVVQARGDEAERRSCAREDRHTASESLKGANFEVTDEAIRAWWLGREWRSESAQPPLDVPDFAEPDAETTTESDTHVTPEATPSAESVCAIAHTPEPPAPAPTVEPEPPRVVEPQPDTPATERVPVAELKRRQRAAQLARASNVTRFPGPGSSILANARRHDPNAGKTPPWERR